MSDKPMTQNELDDIRRRLEVVTPGPWAFEKEDGKVLLDYTPKEIRICETGCLGSIANRMVCDMNVDWRYTYKNENEPMANAEFIAHAPTDIARLMAEVERLREENKRLCGELERVHEEADWLAESLETESPYCEECEFKDEQYYDYGENVTWCAHAPDGTNDTCDQSWRKAARKAIEEERNDE